METPDEARAYIALFRVHAVGKQVDFVQTNKRRIDLDTMTDADALFVAREFRRMEVAAATRGRRYRKDAG